MLPHARREHQCIDAAERGRHGPDRVPDAVHIHIDREARVLVAEHLPCPSGTVGMAQTVQ